jgi:hypothetical protein
MYNYIHIPHDRSLISVPNNTKTPPQIFPKPMIIEQPLQMCQPHLTVVISLLDPPPRKTTTLLVFFRIRLELEWTQPRTQTYTQIRSPDTGLLPTLPPRTGSALVLLFRPGDDALLVPALLLFMFVLVLGFSPPRMRRRGNDDERSYDGWHY